METLQALSRFLFDLDRMTETESPGQFFDRALDRLSDLVAIDSGIWATGAMTPTGPEFHSVVLFRQPPQLLADYEAIKEFDPLFAQSATAPGVPVSATARDTVPLPMMPFIERYHLEQGMSTMDVDPRSRLLTGISVWRSARERPFDDNDRALMQATFAHLIRAAGRCILCHLAAGVRETPGPFTGRASCDVHGRLHQADEPCIALFNVEFPEWTGPDLPVALCAVLDAETTRTLVFAHIAVRLTACPPFVLIEVRPRIAWDRLTASERRVANLAVTGLTYKEIAKQTALAPSTVRNQLASAHRRLGIHNRAQLMASRALADQVDSALE